MPSWQLPQDSKGPAVWQVEDMKELTEVVSLLLSEPLHRRSRGHAAVQGAAKIADSMMTIAWEVLTAFTLAAQCVDSLYNSACAWCSTSQGCTTCW